MSIFARVVIAILLFNVGLVLTLVLLDVIDLVTRRRK